MIKFFQYTSLIVFLGCFLMIWNFGSVAWGQTIHVVLAADTADRNIGPGVQTDLNNMVNLFRANVPAANLSLIALEANAMTPDGMLRSVENLTVAPNDAIVFYYSGHGAFDSNTGKQFLALTQGGNLYRETLLAKIEEKRPRLTVLLTDCCNNEVPIAGARAVTTFTHAPRIPESFSPLFENLFVFCQGTADLTSSQPGEYSFVFDIANGSIFTMAFIDVVNNNRTNGGMFWNDLYEKLGSRSQEIFRIRLPNGFNKGQGEPVQMSQTVHKYRLPGMGDAPPSVPEPVREGPRLGLRAVNHDGIGVRITAIAPNSPASRTDIVVGDIITEINGGVVRNETNYSDAVDGSPRTMVLNLRKEDGTTRTVTVEMGW